VVAPTQSLLGALAITTVVVTAALGWAGWRLLDQQRALDEQRAQDRVESAADAVAAGVQGRLADAAERLSGWVATPSSPVPMVKGATVVVIRNHSVEVNPPGGLPYVPVVVDAGPETAFAALEETEFRGDATRAIAGYRAQATERDRGVRAGALLRLGRVQRKVGDLSNALATYEQLEALGPVRVGDLPAELAGLSGQRATYLAMADHRHANDVDEQLRRGLDEGKWLITRGPAEFYREPFSDPRPGSWRLAEALSQAWQEAKGQLPAQGYRLFAGDDHATGSVLVLWRSNQATTATIVAFTDAFFELQERVPVAWQMVDAEGHVIRGKASPSAPSVSRIVANYPWTLQAWVEPSAALDQSSSRAVLLAMMIATLTFVWGASYFMARAIRHEAAVSRLRTDFVAAVSHEFRSPLTAVRQMAEMLDADRVPTDERRHKYYGMLAVEAARLQQLVETLLNFGRMEAGAERFRFSEVDAAALVREVVDEFEPQARALGKAIEIDGTDAEVRIRADRGALSVALRNLIDNAIKYSPGQPTVWVHWRRDRDRAALCVVDRGVGILRNEQRTIFEKFVRGRAAIDANIRGTGVGLAIVQQIVLAHDGEISLESEPGRGSTFTLLLPVVS
jgi:signal transduction histidine kinase